MRKTFLYTLFGLAMTAAATAGEIYYPAGELLPKMSLPKSKRHPAGGLHPHHVSRGSSSGFIPVSPASKGIPVVNEGKDHDGKRRLLRRDEVVVPDSLQNPASKRGTLSCGDSNYGVCANKQMCCPIDGLCCPSGDCCDKGYRCCTTGECCPETHNCVTVDGINGCCPIGQTCTSTGTTCADAGYVRCANENFCCQPGQTCTRNAFGKASCKAGSTGQTTTTTTTQQPAPTTTTTTLAATTTTPANVQTTTTTTTPQPTTTTTTPEQTTTSTTTTTTDQQIPTTASVSVASVSNVGAAAGGPPTTMYNPTAITTLPNVASVSTPVVSNVDVPVGNASGAMAVTAGIGYSVLVTAVSFALGHVLVMA
ncbi:hypothetical protein FRC04_007559 [Tulasnella sp. 424]|nr:hypothetical protein FRC04_007559 [Tulasnella sp. 424]